MDSGLRQTIGQIDFVHSSRKWLPTILSCGQHRSALSTGFIPRLRLCWRGHTMRKDMRRSALKDVVTEPARNKRQYPTVLQSLKHFVGCWTTNGWFTCSRFMRCTAGNCSRNHKSKPKQKGNRDVDQLTHVDYLTTDANSSQGESQLYIFEDNEAVIKMIKGRSPTMRHVQNQRSKSNMFTPKANQQTCWTHGNSPTEQWYTVSTSCLDDHNFKRGGVGNVWRCVQGVLFLMVLKRLSLVRVSRRDIL